MRGGLVDRSRPPRRPPRWDVVPTSGGARRLARLDRADDARFRSLVDRVGPAIERSLTDDVFANRARRSSRPAALAPWRPAHRRWRRAIGDACAGGGVAIATDVEGCYASITPEAVGRALERVGASAEHVAALVRWLRALGELGVEGLPVGPEPSAILANAVLGVGDRALERSGVRWLRWVDDWVIVAGDLRAAERSLAGLASALDAEGLRLHGAKTHRWRDARDLVREVGSMRRSLALGEPVADARGTPGGMA
jgi:hypothetical protein